MPYIDRVDNTVAARGSQKIETYTVKAAVTVKRGDFLKFTSAADTVEQALTKVADSGYTVYAGAIKIAGMALHDAAAGESVAVLTPTDETEYLVRLVGAGDTSAGAAAVAADCEQRDYVVGTAYSMGIHTVGASGPGYYGMTSRTTNPELILMEKCPESATDDNFGLVWVKVSSAYRALSVGR